MKPHVEVLSQSELWDVHCASLDILENVGVDVLFEPAREVLQESGARIDGEDRVRIPARLVKASLDSCPPVVLLYGREGLPPLRIGGSRVYYGTCGYPTWVLDWQSGDLRPARLADLEEAARLTDVLDNIDFTMPPLSPEDVPADTVDRYQWLACLLNTRKPVVNQCYGAEGFDDMVEMASTLAGGLAELQSKPFISPLICVTSPLTLRQDVCEVIMGSAELSLPLFTHSGPMAGATAPATLAGVLAMANAEQLAAIVLSKAVNESAPIIYASWARTMDMKFGNVTLGAPEFALLRVASTQLARMYGLPTGGGALLTDSNVPDAQSGYEKMGSALLPALAGMNMITGAAAYGVELVLSLEGYVIDDEIVGWVKRVLQGFAVDDGRLASDLVARKGPRTHYVDEDHTLQYYRQEMWIPQLSDRSGTTAWMERGQHSVRARARELVKKKLAQHMPLDLPADMAERLQAVIDRREQSQA